MLEVYIYDKTNKLEQQKYYRDSSRVLHNAATQKKQKEHKLLIVRRTAISKV